MMGLSRLGRLVPQLKSGIIVNSCVQAVLHACLTAELLAAEHTSWSLNQPWHGRALARVLQLLRC